ncbi:PDZ domain-containing protein [Halopenitus malekzadehii]|uniref:PDZ domain-containing protein n=1 Tax=Halopenitus malekzadehii TaxID=1267564 RepID=A0A1H6IQ95_9EURY|nr:site-2 protease family protein [Halopenitus malekzadehii]SEH49665.1 PDZ domain-containing protein [Halopenitus malekzadehii]
MSSLLWILLGVLAYTAAAAWLDNRGLLPESVRVSGPMTTIHTKRGKAILDRLSAPKRLWRAVANVGVGVALVIMVGTFLLLIANALSVLSNPPEPTGINTPQNVLIIPGVNDFLPLSVALEIVCGLLVALVVHEGAHGLVCRVEDIDIDSMGLALFTLVPVGAFVEPDEESTGRANRGSRTRMFAAGVTANFIVVLVTFGLLFGPVAGAVSVAPGAAIGGAYPGSPAAEAGIGPGDRIVAVGGAPVDNATDLSRQLSENTDDRITVTLHDGTDRTIDRSLLVTGVAETSPLAGDGGLAVNDTITAVDGDPVTTEAAFREAVGDDHVATIETANGTTVEGPIGALTVVVPDGPLNATAGAPAGEDVVITAVGDDRVVDGADLSAAIDARDPGETVTIVGYVDDDREEFTVTLGSNVGDGAAAGTDENATPAGGDAPTGESSPDDASAGDRSTGDAYLGVQIAAGFSGVSIDSLGVTDYPAAQYLSMLTGTASDTFLGTLLLITVLPFYSIVDPSVQYNFAGFVGTNVQFYDVTGPLSALGDPAVFLGANVLFWTGWINLQLAFFNCIPAFPLDGGRILRTATEAVVSRLPVDAKPRLTRTITTGIGVTMLVALLVMLFGPVVLG